MHFEGGIKTTSAFFKGNLFSCANNNSFGYNVVTGFKAESLAILLSVAFKQLVKIPQIKPIYVIFSCNTFFIIFKCVFIIDFFLRIIIRPICLNIKKVSG